MSHSSLQNDQNDSSNDNAEGNNTTYEDGLRNLMLILDSKEVYESPIDINISRVIPVNDVAPLNWVNYEVPPKKMKITNTGHTVILSGKWGQERPYITNGVLTGKYVFSQMHLHWGINDMEGSEHTIDGAQCPGEMHVVTFKSCYLTQESALKETDGVAIFVYLFRLQDPPNPGFQVIVDALPGIAKAHTSMKIGPVQLGFIMRQFDSDYFMYRGAVSTAECVHHIKWMISRVPIGVNSDQIDSLRFLLDNDDELLKRNFRTVQPTQDRPVFHILPSASKYSTLLPNPDLDTGEKIVTQIYRCQIYHTEETQYLCKELKRKMQKKWCSKMRTISDEHHGFEDESRRNFDVNSVKEYTDISF